MEEYTRFESRPATWFNNLLSSILLAFLYKTRLRARSGQPSEGGLHVALLPAPESAEDPSNDVFREPPKLPLLAGLVGFGIHLLAAAWMILWFLALKHFSQFLLEPSNLEFLSALVLRLAFFVFSGFVSSTIVLQYASVSNVQGQVLETFQQELQLVSTDGLEDGTNDDKIYLTTMLRRSTAWIVALVLGFHVIVFAELSLLSMLKVTAGMHWCSNNGIFSSIGVLAVGAASCLVGMSLARQLTLRNPENTLCTETWTRLLRRREICTTHFFSGALNYLPVFSEARMMFESSFGYKFYHASPQPLIAFVLWTGCIILVTERTLYFSISHGRRQDWQWMAFGTGAAVFPFFCSTWHLLHCIPIKIHGWYEIVYSLLILLWIAVDVGVICGGVADLYGIFYVRSIFQKIAE